MALPTTIIVSQTRSGKLSPVISQGFSDSSFDYSGNDSRVTQSKSMCYIGDARAVCSQIQKYADSINNEYRHGAHDSIELKSCLVGNGWVVLASYHLTDDYGGDLNVERHITRCVSN